MVQALDRSIERITWTRDRYIAAYRAGLLPENTELIAGDIVAVPVPDPLHETAIRLLMKIIQQALFAEGEITCEKSVPIALSPKDQPVADLVIIPDAPLQFIDEHPKPDEVYLVVEVANSHPERDHKIKLPQYATAGIQEYWVADLQRRELLVYRHPQRDYYQSQQVWEKSAIKLLRFPQIEIDLKLFLNWLSDIE
ncbi:MAG: Uma2 family endonuclease [Leptolyngbyaceae cyanobacterium]